MKQGSHSIDFDPQGFIHVTLRGKLTMDLISTLVNEITQVVQEYQCFRLLIDIQEMEVKLSVAQVYALPDLFSQLAENSGFTITSFKRALLMKQTHSLFHFFETISVNRGQNVHIFHDVEAARQWLINP